MRYKLDASGYIRAVSFGCDIDGGTEYTGAIPSGYKTLDDWATDSCIQAYYIDVNGNLVLDFERKLELENRQEQETIDNSCVLRKDIFETESTVEGQYARETATGKVVVLKDIKTIAPKVKITGIQHGYEKLSIYAHGKNMMPCHAEACVISGVTFTKNASGSLTILGTSTEPIEYVIADGKDTTLFALKPNLDYYLNLGGLQCELSYFDGETTAQQYIGASGLLNLPEHIEVTKVVIKIASGDSLNTTFYPQLEYGKEFTSYDSHKLKALEINVGELEGELVFPSDTLYADDELYPGTYPSNIDYILVENGKISISVDNKVKLFKSGSMGLFSAYNTVYATKDVDLEIEYSANFLLVDSLAFLQGKETTTKRFKILKDGSIEANNGYFSGTIHADSGYFKGTIEFEKLLDEKGNPIDEIITTITRNTVTTAFVNALSVTAGFVNAENIIGTVITGKTLSGGIVSGGTIDGNDITGGTIRIGSNFYVDKNGNVDAKSLTSSSASITGGKIGGFDIHNKGIKSGKSDINSDSAGIYIGTDGINVGSKSAFKVTSQGDVSIGTIGGLTLGNSATLTFVGGLISVEDDGVYLGLDRSTHLKRGELKIGSSATYYTTIVQNQITFGSGSDAYIKKGNETLMSITQSTVSMHNSVILGDSNGKVGFFSQAGSTKKTVSKITATSPTASTVANKVNELIEALRGYGLIAI